MRFSAIAIFAISFLTASPADAAFVDGNALYNDCSADEKSTTYYQQQARCMGYILAAYDMIEFYQGNNRQVCLPPRVVSGQIRDIVVKDLRENPAGRHLSAAVVIYAALALAFPCQSQAN